MPQKKKIDYEKLRKSLFGEKKDGWLIEKAKVLHDYAKGYKQFLSIAKTERETVAEAINLAKKKGFVPYEEFVAKKPKTLKGTKIFFESREKNVCFVILSDSVDEGLNIVGSHVDAPRIDFKPNPIMEENGVAMAKTHYYGGIKKYQWLSIPLAIHGVVIKTDGEVVRISIGEKKDDPVFVFPDLLPHLDKRVMSDKTMAKAVEGERMNLLLGSIPITDDPKVKEAVKLNIMKIINEQYGITAEDFVSAEIEIVPAFQPKDVGFDRSLVAAYGQDDRICAYTSLTALFDAKNISKTSLSMFFDKEEIGSDGNTGAQSIFILDCIHKIIKLYNKTADDMFDVLKKTNFLSSDVGASVNPNYPEVHDKYNSSKLGHGITISKYTGSGGKYSANDANPEFIAKIRKIFNENKVLWQMSELGKVDEGGGGTIAKFMAKWNMNVIDAGPGLIAMHSPYELVSKVDLYHAYKAYKVFYESMN